MAVKILIKRQVAEKQSEELLRLLKHMRALTMAQPGYISGETLTRIDRPGQNLVISTWTSADAWRTWVLSRQRSEIQERIDTLLGEKTQYEIYAYV